MDLKKIANKKEKLYIRVLKGENDTLHSVTFGHELDPHWMHLHFMTNEFLVGM